jgi:hypothetical protein
MRLRPNRGFHRDGEFYSKCEAGFAYIKRYYRYVEAYSSFGVIYEEQKALNSKNWNSMPGGISMEASSSWPACSKAGWACHAGLCLSEPKEANKSRRLSLGRGGSCGEKSRCIA